MLNKKFSEFDVNINPKLTDVIPIINDGVTKKINLIGLSKTNLQMELGWGSGSTIGVNGERVRLLNVNTNINSILTGNTGDEVWLFIERYKGAKTKTNNLGDSFMSKAGWKHETHPNEYFPNRPSEIRLTAATNNDFYFGQEEYFTFFPYDPVNNYTGRVLAKGTGGQWSNRRANVYLRFKLKIGSDVNGWVYTEPLARIKLMFQFNLTPNFSGWQAQLNYKYV
jgi:hypothetical protein